MRLAALILGVAGGILAPAGMLFIVSVWRDEEALPITQVGFLLGALPTGVLGIIGGTLSPTKPRLAAALMLLAGIWGANWGWLALTAFGWPLLLVGSALAFLSRDRGPISSKGNRPAGRD